ncbi:unnamed protein product [Mytilus edulis]|uniref:Ig-like domain-containing protein n=1 Tax=Mytilus edulis TaxID=6550 RepID=A0A8S3RF84_MYTED|nr:unnamed protein product [Mytilus edulis]
MRIVLPQYIKNTEEDNSQIPVCTKRNRTLSAKVSIDLNTTGYVGNKDTHVTCSFFLEKDEQIYGVQIMAKNITEEFDSIKPIAMFLAKKGAKLYKTGHHLSGRVTLTNITTTSTNATMTFDELQCEDEKDYICRLYCIDMNGDIFYVSSEATRIIVQAFPSMPDVISSFIVSSIITDTQTNITSNILRGSNKSSTRTDQNSNTSFSTLTSLREGLTFMKSLLEGDTLMFTCTGNIGKPPEEIRSRCTFKGTTNLTLQISADDAEAKIRCFEESQANVPGMYLETEQLDVHFQIKHVNVNKQPNKEQYDGKTNQINLTCSAIGNPEPEYIWFKQDNRRNILSRTNTYVIEDVNRNNSGIYTCEAFNIINNAIYRNSFSVAIDIGNFTFACLCAFRFIFSEAKIVHSNDRENISEDNDYAEIERISYYECNPHNDKIETSNQPITEEEIVLENIHTTTCTSCSESDIPLSHLYENTYMFNTNEIHKVADNHETISDHQNGLGNCQIGVNNTFDSNNYESDTLYVNQYVNTASLRVPNVYEDLNQTTVETQQKYESPQIEGNTNCTE